MQQPDEDESDSDYVPGKEEKYASDTDSEADAEGDSKRARLNEEGDQEEDPEERKARLQR